VSAVTGGVAALIATASDKTVVQRTLSIAPCPVRLFAPSTTSGESRVCFGGLLPTVRFRSQRRRHASIFWKQMLWKPLVNLDFNVDAALRCGSPSREWVARK
jgi:hypothetical protein